ncbi:unnamed protein product [Moneuplotes crassus]|uniref:Uncharacterized protein n=1 Tax=Euplotes crassus TaxID=5936 RepID=A0AAD1XJ29_EUPCR|nr:unnamed protein product [Moneuplotes crassus]
MKNIDGLNLYCLVKGPCRGNVYLSKNISEPLQIILKIQDCKDLRAIQNLEMCRYLGCFEVRLLVLPATRFQD